MSRRAALAALVLLASAAAGCKSSGTTLNDRLQDLIGEVDSLLGGGKTAPSHHLVVIRDVHERKSWRFREDVDHPLERTRDAVRALASSDYASWGEAALVVQVLSSMADEHDSALVRAESLDALARMAPWTLSAAVPPGRTVTDSEVVEALKAIKDARGRTDTADPQLTGSVAHATQVLSSYRFDAPRDAAADRSLPEVAREYAGKLKTARGVLLAFTGSTLEGFQTDLAVREALDRAYVNVSAAVIRLTLLEAASGDPAETTRIVAVRHLGDLQPEGAAPILRQVLASDGAASVRREAATALGQWPEEVAVPALLPALADDMPDVRGAAARALEHATDEKLGDDRVAWQKWWQARSASPEAAPGTAP